ncbi:MAG: SbcC/MukB-like Walker B domain-containing protein, partial [Cryobacterium sp.]
ETAPDETTLAETALAETTPAESALVETAPEAPADPDLAWFEAALQTIERRLAVATVRAEEASAALVTATSDCEAVEDRRRRQDRRDTAAAALAELDGRAAEIATRRERLTAAERAARVWPQVRANADARSEVATADAAERSARRAWVTVLAGAAESTATAPGDALAHLDPHDAAAPAAAQADLDAAGLAAVVDERLRQLGGLSDILSEERRLPALAGRITDLELLAAEHTTALDTARLLLLALPERIDAAADALAEASLGAARLPEAEAAVSRAETALAAADDVRRLETELVGVHRAEREAVALNSAAALEYQHLVDRRLGGFAIELAAELVDGSPCAVCGATEHPAPTTGDAELVTEEDLDAARQLMSSRQAAVDTCRTQSQAVATRLTEARTRAGTDDADQLDAALTLARQALDEAAGQLARVPTLETALAGLRADQAEAQTALAPLQLARDETAVQLAELRTERETIAARVEAQRSGFASVTDRAHRLQAELDAARSLTDAVALCASARRAAETAADALARQLAEEGFADEAEVVAARLTPAQVHDEEDSIRAHDDELAAARGVLAEPELAGLPADPIDVEPARETRRLAGEARDAAIARRGSLGERTDALTALVADARATFSLAADLLARHSQVRQLAAVVHGDDPNTKRMKLETYVLAAQLEEIIAAANNRLRTMTGGRYALEHDDALQYRGSQAGLGLAIRDEHTGRARATHSLSGGETFLASLALALGLAEVVSNQAGGIALDTLFVDEGFGSLDAETLETAMSTLDSLRAGGRTIGLISHVESMKEQIPAKLQIRVTPQGYSEIDAPRSPAPGALSGQLASLSSTSS